MPVSGSPRSTQFVGGCRPAVRRGTDLHAWLYDVMPDGTSYPTWTGHPPKVVQPTTGLYVSVDAGGNIQARGHLRVPAAPGMAAEPVSVSLDEDTGHWQIRNRGRTNTLRIQPFGLRAVPLRPNATTAMPGTDVAVWIPVVPRGGRPDDRAEAFRLLILHAPEPPRGPGPTLDITGTKIRALTPEMHEAVIMFFGEYLSWPPLPTPHTRKESEVKEIAERYGLLAEKGPNWARNRNDVLAGSDGLFTSQSARWYQPLGGAVRSAGNYLPAFQRFIELGAVTGSMVCRWSKRQGVEPYLIMDERVLIALCDQALSLSGTWPRWCPPGPEEKFAPWCI